MIYTILQKETIRGFEPPKRCAIFLFQHETRNKRSVVKYLKEIGHQDGNVNWISKLKYSLNKASSDWSLAITSSSVHKLKWVYVKNFLVTNYYKSLSY